MVRNYKKYEIYKKGMLFVSEIYSLTKNFPKEEMYGLSSQLRRATTSIVLNFVEGSAKNTEKEFNKFLVIAYASSKEVEVTLEISLNLEYISKKDYQSIISKLNNIQKLIGGLKKLIANS